MLRNFLCADPIITTVLIIDGIFFVAAIALLIWYFVKNRNKTASKKVDNKSISKVDDDTYVIEGSNEAEPEAQVFEEDNNVVHFVNQITAVNKEGNDEHAANAVVINHEVEAPVKKIVSKDEIENFVMLGGERKTKTEEEIDKTVNRGTNAFKNATNFLNTIKSEQSSEDLSSKKVSRKKQ